MDLPQVIGVKLKTWNEKTIVEGLVLIEVLQQPRKMAPLPHQVRASPGVPRSGSFLASFSFATPKFRPRPVVTDELAPLQVLKPHATQRRHDEQRQDDFVGAICPHHQEHHVEELPGLQFNGLDGAVSRGMHLESGAGEVFQGPFQPKTPTPPK